MKLIPLPEVERRTLYSRTTIYKLMQSGAFPRAVKIGVKARGWVEEEVDNWVQAKVMARDREQANG